MRGEAAGVSGDDQSGFRAYVDVVMIDGVMISGRVFTDPEEYAAYLATQPGGGVKLAAAPEGVFRPAPL